MSKKLLVWLLALCMMLSIAVVAVSAAETQTFDERFPKPDGWTPVAGAVAEYGIATLDGNGTVIDIDWQGTATSLLTAFTCKDASNQAITNRYVRMLGDWTMASDADRITAASSSTILDFNGYKVFVSPEYVNKNGALSKPGYCITLTSSVTVIFVDTYTGHERVGGVDAAANFTNGFAQGNDADGVTNIVFGEGNYVIGGTSAISSVAGVKNVTIKGGTFNATRDLFIYSNNSGDSAPSLADLNLQMADESRWDGFTVYSAGAGTLSDTIGNLLGVPVENGYRVFQQGTTTDCTDLTTLTKATTYVVRKVYTISASSADVTMGTVSPASAQYPTGGQATVTATPATATGYMFSGWYENGVKVSDAMEYTFTVSGARSLEARFEAAEVAWGADAGDLTTAGSLHDAILYAASKKTPVYIKLFKDSASVGTASDGRYTYATTSGLDITIDLNGWTISPDASLGLAKEPSHFISTKAKVTIIDNSNPKVTGRTGAIKGFGTNGTLFAYAGATITFGKGTFDICGIGPMGMYDGGNFVITEDSDCRLVPDAGNSDAHSLRFYNAGATPDTFSFTMPERYYDGFTILAGLAITDSATKTLREALGIPEGYEIFDRATGQVVTSFEKGHKYLVRSLRDFEAKWGVVENWTDADDTPAITDITTWSYGSLDEAVKAIKNKSGAYIQLLNDAFATYTQGGTTITNKEGRYPITGTYNFTFDLAGHSVMPCEKHDETKVVNDKVQAIWSGAYLFHAQGEGVIKFTDTVGGGEIKGFVNESVIVNKDNLVIFDDASYTVSTPIGFIFLNGGTVKVNGGNFENSTNIGFYTATHVAEGGFTFTMADDMYDGFTISPKFAIADPVTQFDIPEGYQIWNQITSEVVTSMAASTTYVIVAPGTVTDEAKWGASSENLTVSGTLAEAFAAAENDGVTYIQLQKNISVEGVIVPAGVTFDLNGKWLTTATGIEAGDGTKVIDTTGKARIFCSSSKYIVLAADNGYVPVNTGNGFMLVTVKHQRMNPETTSDGFSWKFLPDLGVANQYLATGKASNVKIHVKLVSSALDSGSLTLVASSEVVTAVYAGNKAFRVNVTGVDSLEGAGLTAQIEVYANGVTVATQSIVLQQGAAKGVVVEKTAVEPGEEFLVTVMVPEVKKNFQLLNLV